MWICGSVKKEKFNYPLDLDLRSSKEIKRDLDEKGSFIKSVVKFSLILQFLSLTAGVYSNHINKDAIEFGEKEQNYLVEKNLSSPKNIGNARPLLWAVNKFLLDKEVKEDGLAYYTKTQSLLGVPIGVPLPMVSEDYLYLNKDILKIKEDLVKKFIIRHEDAHGEHTNLKLVIKSQKLEEKELKLLTKLIKDNDLKLSYWIKNYYLEAFADARSILTFAENENDYKNIIKKLHEVRSFLGFGEEESLTSFSSVGDGHATDVVLYMLSQIPADKVKKIDFFQLNDLSESIASDAMLWTLSRVSRSMGFIDQTELATMKKKLSQEEIKVLFSLVAKIQSPKSEYAFNKFNYKIGKNNITVNGLDEENDQNLNWRYDGHYGLVSFSTQRNALAFDSTLKGSAKELIEDSFYQVLFNQDQVNKYLNQKSDFDLNGKISDSMLKIVSSRINSVSKNLAKLEDNKKNPGL